MYNSKTITMDKETVLTIIEMLDDRIKNAHNTWDMTGDASALQVVHELNHFKDFFKKLIEPITIEDFGFEED